MSLSGEMSSLGSHASLAFFRRKFPYYSQRSYNEIKEAKARYKKWGSVYVLVAVTLLFALPVVFAYLGYGIYVFGFNSFINKGETFYPATWLSFVVVGFFWALSTLVWMSEWLMRILLRNRFDEFEDYYNHNQGYDNHKAGLYVSKIAFIISMVVFPFTFNQYIIERPQNFDIKTIVDLSRHRYSYKDVNKIVYYSKYRDKQGLITPRPDYDILMKDGKTFGPVFYFNDIESVTPFVHTLSERGNISIDTVDIQIYK